MSSSPTRSPTGPGLSARAKKVIVPKVWKRPHSQIYGKNVEYGSSLYSDKIGELNGRKFNSDLPWHVRNSGGSVTSSGGSTSQGYISSRLLNNPESTLIGSVLVDCSSTSLASGRSDPSKRYYYYNAEPTIADNDQRDHRLTIRQPAPLSLANCSNYAQVLELSNPNRYSKRRLRQQQERRSAALASRQPADRPRREPRIDFYDQYMELTSEIERQKRNSLLQNEPLLRQRTFNNFLDFDYELGLFVPSYQSDVELATGGSGGDGGGFRGALVGRDHDGRCLIGKKTIKFKPYDDVDAASYRPANLDYDHAARYGALSTNPTDPTTPFAPVITTTKQTHLLPKHDCSLASSPYGQSTDGRKLSLGSINPHSYRPSLPSKTTTVHASDGEEFDLQDRSSPFFTDRWAGKTIRHFDSDLYSNANLFKTMIL